MKRYRVRYPPAPPEFLPTHFDGQLLMQVVDFVARCQQGSDADSMNYIAPNLLSKIRCEPPHQNRIYLADANRALRLLKNEFPIEHPIWGYVVYPQPAAHLCHLLLSL